MSRQTLYIVFVMVFVAVTGVGAWITEAFVLRWLRRRYQMNPKQKAQSSLGEIEGKLKLWWLYTIEVAVLSAVAFVGAAVGIIAMALAMETF
jgi:hypothetical protein